MAMAHPIRAWGVLALPALLLSTLALIAGCSHGTGYTFVEKRVKPSHFKFVPIVAQVDPGPGGWRAACLYLRLAHDIGSAFMCKVGVEVPIETDEAGPVSVSRAQLLASRCANEAADFAFSSSTPATPLGIACTSFIGTYRVTLNRALAGSRVVPYCRPEAESAAGP